MSDYENALRAAADLNVSRTPQLDKLPILYTGRSLDIKYTVCPESDVARRCKTIYTIDVKRLCRLHKDKWFEVSCRSPDSSRMLTPPSRSSSSSWAGNLAVPTATK